MTGSYVLLIELPHPATVEVGSLGAIRFEAGCYAYVGSAMGGLQARVARHLSDDKRLHWHIDYLLQHARVADVVRVPSAERLECAIARELRRRLDAVPDFGCSDCDCPSHLLRATDLPTLRAAVREAVAAVSPGQGFDGGPAKS